MGELAFMPKPKHAVALDLLKKRNGQPSEVTLASGVSSGFGTLPGDMISVIPSRMSPRTSVPSPKRNTRSIVSTLMKSYVS
jgi:hypothetical protein